MLKKSIILVNLDFLNQPYSSIILRTILRINMYKVLWKKLGFMKKCAEHTFDYIDFYCHMGYLLSFVVSYRLFVFFNNANTVSAEMWVWGFGNHAWYKSLIKSLVFDSWLETFVSLVISKTPYSHFLLTVFSQWTMTKVCLEVLPNNI